MRNDEKAYVYRVGKPGVGFYAFSLNYFDKSQTGYKRENAKKYLADFSDARVFDPIIELNLIPLTWGDIRGKIKNFEAHSIPYDELSDDDEWGSTSCDALAEVGLKNGYDFVILRNIPSDHGWGEPYDELFVCNSTRVTPIDQLDEQLLLELNRNQLIQKSKRSDNYKDTSLGRNRWERRNHSKISTRVDQYNKINMNDFFKKDVLRVGINVKGETDDYVVTIRFNHALRAIADEIKRNNSKLEFKCILVALQRTFNNGNVFVSCTCPDWKYRQSYQATKGGYNSGDPEMIPADMTNPHDSKGAGCKHVNLVIGNIDWIMKISSVINNYIYYMEQNYERLYADFIFPRLFGMPYQRAVQLNLFDYTQKGDLRKRPKLATGEDEIKLSNRYGRERTRFQKDVRINNMRNFRGAYLEQNTNNNQNSRPILQQRVSDADKDE